MGRIDILSDPPAARFQDAYAGAVVGDFLSPEPDNRATTALAETFTALLTHWRDEVLADGRTFTVLALPREEDTMLARKLLRSFEGQVVYLREHFAREMSTFIHDAHWNEYGNLEMASVLSSLEELPFHAGISRQSKLDHVKARIDRYYEEHRASSTIR